MDLESLEKIYTSSGARLLRLLTVRTTLVVLVTWILVAAGENLKEREVAELLAEIDASECLATEFSWTLQPRVEYTCDSSGAPSAGTGSLRRVEQALDPVTPEQLDLAAGYDERLGVLYDKVFHLRADVLGNDIAIDLRFGIWTLPLLIAVFELLIFVQGRKLRFARSIYRHETERTKSDDATRRRIVFEAVSKHPH